MLAEDQSCCAGESVRKMMETSFRILVKHLETVEAWMQIRANLPAPGLPHPKMQDGHVAFA